MFFSNFYSWFSGLYGQQLHDFLRGLDWQGELTAPNLYPRLFLITLGISFVLAVYFYIINRSSRFNRWWSWLIVLGIGAALCAIVGFSSTYSRYDEMPDCFKYSAFEEYQYVETTTTIEGDIDSFDYESLEDSMDDPNVNVSSEAKTRGGLLVGVPGTESVFVSTFAAFAFANAVIGVLFFLVLSLVFMNFSVNCKYCPFNFKLKN